MTKIKLESPDIETASPSYAKRFSGHWGAYLLAQQKQLVAQCFPVGDNLRILEIGGGHAQLVDIYAERGVRATIYGSEGAEVERLAPYDIDYISGNVIKLPFEDASFDVVIAIRLLTHLGQWELLLAEMCRVSKEVVIVEYPSKMSLNAIAPLLFKFKKKFEGDTRTFRLFSDSELKNAFGMHNYATVSRKGQFFFPLVLHRMFKSNRALKVFERLLSRLKLTDKFGSPVVMSAHKKDRSPAA